ncbi:virulence factor, partial [Streptomyces griseorubiginosus]
AHSARSEADAASQAAADADAAATRAEAAAKRARSDADAAQAAKLRADAAVRTATSAAADAIKASEASASAARTAVKLADEAEKHAADAMKQADAAKAEAAKAVAGAADAAGHAYTTAQAAEDAGNAAQQVAAPANDAIQLGAPYVTTDSAAGLAVLSGQSSKTIAEQQQAVAEAHAANAQKNAAQAASLAAAATGDAKAAYTLAAEAAGFAADARKSAKEALGYAAEAAQYAADAQASLARAKEYDRQATVDAAAADQAADQAETYAADARSSADQAALDAEAARTAAAAAEQSAKDARAAADRADAEATAAEQAAKDAQKYAESAQEAAEQAANKGANEQVAKGTVTGQENTFLVIDKITLTEQPKQLNGCTLTVDGCTVEFEFHFDAVVSFYYCANPDVPATESGCPKADTFYLGSQPEKGLSKKITYHFDFWEVEKAGLQSLGLFVANLAYSIIVEDFVQCYHKFTFSDDGGSGSGCAWAAATIIPVGKVAEALKAAKLVEDAIKTGRGAEKLLGDLKKLIGEKPSAADLADPDTLAGMALRLSERMAGRAKAANSVDLDLVRKLEASGANFNRADVVMAVRYPRPGVPVAWLELGSHKSGLIHIIFRHAGEFIEHGVASEDIPKLLNKALSEGKIVGQQGADGGRPIYETVYNGRTQRVAITVGDNGYIVGANLA